MNIQRFSSISASNATWPKTNLPITTANHFAAILAWNFPVSVKTLYSDNNWVIKTWPPRAVLSQNRSLLIIWISSSVSPPAKLFFCCFLSSARDYEEKYSNHDKRKFFTNRLCSNLKTHNFNSHQYLNSTLANIYTYLILCLNVFVIQCCLLLPLKYRQNVRIEENIFKSIFIGANIVRVVKLIFDIVCSNFDQTGAS